VLKRIFGPKRAEVGWRKLNIDELHNLYSSPSIIRIMKSWVTDGQGTQHATGEKMNAYRLLMGSNKIKPLGRPIHRG
jgi:hypothetical protein